MQPVEGDRYVSLRIEAGFPVLMLRVGFPPFTNDIVTLIYSGILYGIAVL